MDSIQLCAGSNEFTLTHTLVLKHRELGGREGGCVVGRVGPQQEAATHMQGNQDNAYQLQNTYQLQNKCFLLDITSC